MHFYSRGYQDSHPASLLLEAGADINVYNELRLTPLRKAVLDNSITWAQLLLLNGADVNKLSLPAQVYYKDEDIGIASVGNQLCARTALHHPM